MCDHVAGVNRRPLRPEFWRRSTSRDRRTQARVSGSACVSGGAAMLLYLAAVQPFEPGRPCVLMTVPLRSEMLGQVKAF